MCKNLKRQIKKNKESVLLCKVKHQTPNLNILIIVCYFLMFNYSFEFPLTTANNYCQDQIFVGSHVLIELPKVDSDEKLKIS